MAKVIFTKVSFIFLLCFCQNLQAQEKCIVATTVPYINSTAYANGAMLVHNKDLYTADGKLVYSLNPTCNSIVASPNYKFIFNLCTNEIINTETKSIEKQVNLFNRPKFIDNNGDVYVNGQNNKVDIYKNGIKSTEGLKSNQNATNCGVFSLSTVDGKKILTSDTFKKSFEIPSEINLGYIMSSVGISCSENLKHMSFISGNGKVLKLDLETGKQSVIQNKSNRPIFHKNNGDFQIFNYDDKNKVMNIESYSFENKLLKSVQIPSYGYPCGFDTICESTYRGTMFKLAGQVCDTDIDIISKDSICKNSPDFQLNLKKLSESLNCELEASDPLWQKLDAPKSLTEDQAQIYLKKFQKLNGYNPPKDTAVLLAVSKFALHNSSLRGDLKNTLAILELKGVSAPKEMMSMYPELLDKLKKTEASEFCLSSNEKENYKKTAEQKVESLSKSRDLPSNIILSLNLLSPFLVDLPTKTKEDYVDILGDKIAEQFTARTGASGSTGYYLAANAVAPYFGLPGKPLIDVQQVRKSNSVDIMHVANASFSVNEAKAVEIVPGIYTLNKSVPLSGLNQGDKPFSQNTEIKIGADTYSTSTNVTVLPGKGVDFVNTSESIDHKALWKDKKISGMVFLGSNYLGDQTKNDELVGYYLKYYKNEEFVFSPPKTISGTKSYMLDKISQGEVDYMVKEAHTQGDLHTFSSVSKTAVVYEGVRKLKDGKSETIRIVVPLKDGIPTASLQKNEVAEAMASREKLKGQKPFIYVNNSCNSILNTMSEVETVANKNFVNIGTSSATHSFWWHSSSTLNNVIDGIRKSKTFPEIKAEMSKTNKFQKGYDQFVLPNDPKYEELVTKRISVPIKFDVDIQKNGSPYSFSREAGH